MQSTGHSSTQALSFTSMHGLAITYGTAPPGRGSGGHGYGVRLVGRVPGEQLSERIDVDLETAHVDALATSVAGVMPEAGTAGASWPRKARTLNRCSLPVAVLGSSSTKTTWRGALKCASPSRHHAISSSAGTPSATTTATGFSSPSASATPTTAA